MNEGFKLALFGFTALCLAASLYLGLVVKEGPPPAHEARQASAPYSIK